MTKKNKKSAFLSFCVGFLLWYLATQPRDRGEHAVNKQII